jgi:hypothetical protein
VTRRLKTETSLTPVENSPPRMAEFMLGALVPTEIEQEFIEDFGKLYRSWATPKYGKLAPYWAWMQVVKTGVVVLYDAVWQFWSRKQKRAK